MKQRYSSLDVKVICRELSSNVVGLRLANIYDLSSRIFLFKLAVPDVRKQLVIDAGFRCHLTDYARTTADAPSHFVSRLRKFLKTRRITAVRQVGTDRIIEFEFSDGLFHLFLEFFAAGNLILTDSKYEIVALLRQIPAGSDLEETRVGLKYTLDNKQNYNGIPPLSDDRLKDALEKGKERDAIKPEAGKNKKSKKKNTETLRRALYFGFPEFPPSLLDHAFYITGFDSSLRPDQVLEENKLLKDLMKVIEEADRIYNGLSASYQPDGYIVARTENQSSQPSNDPEQPVPKPVYKDFHPFEPSQLKDAADTTIIHFNSFNKAVDEFFSSVEGQKLESRRTEREDAARRKLEASKRDHEKRVGALKEVQELHTRKAQTIEANLDRVEEAMNAVNGLVAQGMDWVEIARLIEMEQSRQNPVAKTIKLPLKLYENTITLILRERPEEDSEESSESEEEDDEDEDEDEDDYYAAHDTKPAKPSKPTKPQQDQVLKIDIDLGLSPWANSRQYYGQKKSAAVKEEKTLNASKKALKSTEKKINSDLKQGLKQEKPILRPARTPAWFEKFHFFVSSDGYLVLGGRDAQQTEILYQRYLKKGDVFVHADIDGAAPMVIKNKIETGDSPIPPSTLSQAGTFSISMSKAWDTKAMMGAWWVQAHQVSKLTRAGEYLPTGEFLINGEKEHLAPSQLLLGFAVMFQVTPESVANHTKHQLSEASGQVTSDTNDLHSGSAGDFAESGVTSQQQQSEGESDSDRNSEASDNDDGRSGSHRNEEEITEEKDLQDNMAEPAEDKEFEQEEDEEEEEGEERDRKEPSTQGANKPSDTSTPSVAGSTSAPKTKQPTRGKRGKAKRQAAKYKDQDEEDRELALRLLGSAPKPATQVKTKTDRGAEQEAQKQRRKAQHDRAAQAERRRLENFAQKGTAGQKTSQEGQVPQEEEYHVDLSSIPSLVGTPVAGDEIVAAIAVCAPWLALGTYKYRAKLQPGPIKKGKVVKEILHRWVADASATIAKPGGKKASAPDPAQEDEEGVGKEGGPNSLATMELELIRGWRDVEVVNTVPVGKARIVSVNGASGGAAGSVGGVGGVGGKDKGKSKRGGGKGGKGGKKKR